MNAAARAVLAALVLAERSHARRWVARISADAGRRVKGERGDAYAWRQARRHLRRARAAADAIASLGGESRGSGVRTGACPP